jgi:fluoride exporter
MDYAWVALGSALGGVARYWLSGLAIDHLGDAFPWGTIIVNVTGSFIIGFFATLTAQDGLFPTGSTPREFVMTGLCGGYTTFSAFSLQTLNLARSGEVAAAGANVGLSVVLCLVAVWLGHLAALALDPAKGVS